MSSDSDGSTWELQPAEKSPDPNVERQESYHLTASMVALLKVKLDKYQQSTNPTREKISNECADQLRSEVEEIAGRRLSKKKGEDLKQAVRSWFHQNSTSYRAPTKKKTWSIRWHPRLVFQSSRSRAILYLARVLATGGTEPSLRALIDDEERFLAEEDITADLPWGVLDDDDDDGTGEGDLSPAKRVFAKYQVATSLLWTALMEDEKQVYHDLAEKWKSERPPVEERQKLADKYASRRCLAFATDMFNDLDARVYILLAYQTPKGESIAVEVDFNEAVGAGKAFKHQYRKQIQEGGVLEHWREYTGAQFAADTSDSSAKIVKSHKRPLAAMAINEYGEPQLPGVGADRDGESHGLWLAHVLRSFLIMHYALAMGLPATSRPKVPWRNINENVRKFITIDCLPDDIACSLDDPSGMNLPKKEKLWFHLLELQRAKKPFEFHSYYVEKTGRWEPRSPRKKLISFDDVEEMDYGELRLSKKSEKGKKKSPHKRRSKKSAQEQSDAESDSSASEAPTARSKGKTKKTVSKTAKAQAEVIPRSRKEAENSGSTPSESEADSRRASSEASEDISDPDKEAETQNTSEGRGSEEEGGGVSQNGSQSSSSSDEDGKRREVSSGGRSEEEESEAEDSGSDSWLRTEIVPDSVLSRRSLATSLEVLGEDSEEDDQFIRPRSTSKSTGKRSSPRKSARLKSGYPLEVSDEEDERDEGADEMPQIQRRGKSRVPQHDTEEVVPDVRRSGRQKTTTKPNIPVTVATPAPPKKSAASRKAPATSKKPPTAAKKSLPTPGSSKPTSKKRNSEPLTSNRPTKAQKKTPARKRKRT